MTQITITVPEALLQELETRMRKAVADAVESQNLAFSEGFLDVAGAASYLSSSPSAVRSLVKRNAIPYHKAPTGRLLFDRRELEAWVRVA